MSDAFDLIYVIQDSRRIRLSFSLDITGDIQQYFKFFSVSFFPLRPYRNGEKLQSESLWTKQDGHGVKTYNDKKNYIDGYKIHDVPVSISSIHCIQYVLHFVLVPNS